MDHSPSQPPNFDTDNNSAPHGRNGNAAANDTKDSSSHRMVADQLMAALASGDLQHLAQARQAFLSDGPAESTPANLDAQLTQRSNNRPAEQTVVGEVDLSAEEESLKQAELELRRR